MTKPVTGIIFLIALFLFGGRPVFSAQSLVTLNVSGKPTKDILSFMLQKRGIEPIIDSAINSTTTVKFSDITWSDAFQAILDLHQLECRFADNLAVIFPRRKQTTRTPDRKRENHSAPITVNHNPAGQNQAGPVKAELEPLEENGLSQRELLKRAGLPENEVRFSSQNSSQDWDKSLQAINRIGHKDPLNIRPRFGHLKNNEMVELSKNMLLQEEPLKTEKPSVKTESRLPDESLKDHKGITLVGVTGPDDDKSAILLIDGQHRLLKKGSTVSGYKTISSIEHNKVVIEGENGEVQIVQF
jgi:hypothetical protein